MSHKLRRVLVTSAGVTLLAGTGAIAVNQGFLGGSDVAAPHRVTATAVCDWEAAGTASNSPATLTSVTGDLVLPVGRTVPYRVQLSHSEEHPVDVPGGSAPVLVATTGVEATVVGYAPVTSAPHSSSVAPGDVAEHADFAPFVACPDGPTADDGVHLAPGSYEMFAAQALGWETDTRSGPFNTWARLGTVSITPPPARSQSTDLAEAPAPVGTCGSSLDLFPPTSSHAATFDELEPVLASVGSRVDPQLSLTHGGTQAITDAMLDGPVLLVAQDGQVVARSQILDPVPGPGLSAGRTVSFGEFDALKDCRTNEHLAPGVYEYAVAQQAYDPRSITPFGASRRGGALAVTDQAEATRPAVARPELALCGESATQVPTLEGSTTATVAYAGRATRNLAAGTIARDTPDGDTTVELAFTYEGPERAMGSRGHHAVLVRDGAVVAHSEQRIENGATVGWPTGSAHTAALQGWTDCAGEPFDAQGQYTALGFVEHSYTDEWGLPTRHVTTLPPTPVTFAP